MVPLSEILGYEFTQPKLLREALSHPSLMYEQQKAVANNQRMEFLGDAVLQLTLSEMLYRLFPKAQEGQLTQLRSQLVSTRSLANLARNLDLGPQILMGRSEEINGGRDRDNSLADVFEAILAAIYLDGGLDQARSFVERIFTPRIQSTLEKAGTANPKGKLQEMVQVHSAELPIYTMANSIGPDHDKLFTATVSWRGELLGTGIANSKKAAEAMAAGQAVSSPILKRLLAQKPA
jgi:ribonuclease III